LGLPLVDERWAKKGDDMAAGNRCRRISI